MKDFEALLCPFYAAKAKWSHDAKCFYPYGFSGTPVVNEWQCSLSCSGCRLPFVSGFGRVDWSGGNALAQQAAMKEALRQWNRRS